MKGNTELKWQIGLPVVFFILSLVIVTLVPPRIGVTLSTPEKIVIGGLFFYAPILIRILWLTSKVAGRAEREEKLWDLREECDAQLLTIRNCFIEITRQSYGQRDLFVTHFQKDIRTLLEKIKEVAERQQLRVQADHFLNVDNVLDAFQGASERIFVIHGRLTPITNCSMSMLGSGTLKKLHRWRNKNKSVRFEPYWY
jgi:hypothetical protein